MEVKRSYPSLKLISWFFKLSAVAMVLIGILAVVIDQNRYAIGGLIGCVIAGIFLLACSESLRIFIDIEENTRRTANLLDKMEQQSKQPAPPIFDTPPS